MLLGLAGLAPGYAKQVYADAAEPDEPAAAPTRTETVFGDDEEHTLTGPYTHGNLSVYLVHAQQRDDRDFITLHEGLDAGTAIVSEKESAEVRELMIDNRSDKPLYLQEGDRLIGGKQDRTVHSSIAIAPKSGEVPIPTFCIERSRWSAGEQGALFAASANTGLAPKDVRYAAKLNNSQARVWDEVQSLKAASESRLGTGNSNTSLNEALDSKEVTKLSEDVAKALGDIIAKHPDSVGVAFAVNGTIEEINIYPGHKLFAKLYPRLLESYAVESALGKEADAADDDTATAVEPPTLEAVKAFMTDAPGKRIRQDEINADNRLEVYWAEGRATCVTRYNGVSLHRQWLRSEEPIDRSGEAALQRRLLQELNADPESFNRGSFRQERQQETPNPSNDAQAGDRPASPADAEE